MNITNHNIFYKTLLALFLFILCHTTFADGLACANTFDNKFLIFDNGRIIKQDHKPAKKFWVGSNFIVFVDYLNSLRVYFNGHAYEITIGITEITMDDSLFIWNSSGVLRAWKQGETFLINSFVSFYKVSEGTVVYVDDRNHTLNVWYDGDSWVIDENNMEFPLTSLQLSHRTVAWQTPEYQFKVFINGKIISRSFFNNLFYTTGAGFCAFVNPNTNYFEKLTADGFYDLETVSIKWWTTRYNTLIYLTQNNDLKIVVNDLTTTIGNQKPDISEITVFGIFYNRLQYINYFEKQMEQIVVDYIPRYYYIFNRTFVYRDNSDIVKVWENGTEYSLSASQLAKITPMMDVIVVNEANKIFFWYKGRTYEYQL